MLPERWRQIEEIFLSAADLPKTERDAFLSEKCGEDASLRSEVEKLLAGDDSAADFIEVPIWTDSRFLNTSAKKEISNSLSNGDDGADRDNFLGKRIGPFKLTREIGRGGMGAVYLGERVDGEFDQRVAVKLIKRGMDSDFIIRRFRHERQILASFEHPFIARLLDGGTTEDGVPYFVMEFVEGETLYNYCDSRNLKLQDRLKLFQKVCAAIQYAHDKQIIHRDIKPSNILINRNGTPKLLDFGIAKILDPELIHESLNPTASMLRMMTPDYASPEQVQGGDVTPASDTYSLGVLLYELLTGHRPYNFAGRALHEVARVVCEVMPEPPSKILEADDNLLSKYAGEANKALQSRGTSTQELHTNLADRLDDIVMKALAKDAADRYASVKDFSEDISRYLSGGSVQAPHYNAARGSGLQTYLRPPENSKAIAVLPFKFINLGPQSDSDDVFLGIGLSDALTSRLSKVRRFIVRPTSSMLALGQNVADPIRAGNELKVDYIIDGNIKKANDRLRVSIQLLDVTENAAVWATSIDEMLTDVLTLEDTLANRVIEALLPQLTGSDLQEYGKRGTDVPEAFEHYLRGRYHFNTFTEEGLAKSFVCFHQAIAADPKYAHAYAGIADYYNWLGIIGVLPPQDCFVPAIEAAKKAIDLDINLSEGHASLGFGLHAGNYDWAGAEKHLLRAIDLKPSNANAYVWYSIVLATEGRFDEALQFAARGAELDPLTPFNHHNFGWINYYARRFDDGVSQYRKVISDFPNYPFGYYGMSKIHRFLGDTRIAIEENATAHRLMGESIFSALSDAEAFAADGQTEVALQKIAALKELRSDRYVSPYGMALCYAYLAKVESSVEGDPARLREFCDEAFRHLEYGLEIKDAWLNWLAIDPAMDPLREDPRFFGLVEKLGYGQFVRNDFLGNEDKTEVPRPRIHDRTTLVIDESDTTDSGNSGPYRSLPKRTLIYGAIAASLILFGLVIGQFVIRPWFVGQRAPLRQVALQNAAIVVQPFTSSEGADFNLGVGLADALTTKLGSIRSMRVLSSGTGRSVADQDPKTIASQHGVTFIVRGTLSSNQGERVLTAELVNAPANRVVWTEEFRAANGDLFAIQTRLAEKIWTTLGIVPLPLERAQVEKSYTQSAEAYELYLIGRFQMTRRTPEELRRAISTFAAALKIDGNFAPAYVSIADAYALLQLYDIQPPEDSYKLAKQYAERALEIDENLPEGHATVAYLKFYADRDREAAELEFRRSLQLNPSNAQTHHWFALFFSATGKHAEAIEEIESAKRIDPGSLSVLAAAGMVYFYAGDFQAAIAECDKALKLEPTFLPAIKVKRWTYTAMGDTAAAAASFNKEINYSGGDLSQPGWQIIAAQAGSDRTETLRTLDSAADHPDIRSNPYAFAYETALAYKLNGETSKALTHLERAAAAGSHGFNFAEVDPRFADVRSDPRFDKLTAALRQSRNR